MFRKPKRNIRSQRSKINDSDEEGDVEITKDHKLGRNGSSFKENIEIEEDVSLKEIQSNISKFKEEKLDKKKKKSSKVGNKEEPGGNKTNVAGSTLSFGEDLEGDDGEVFQVKKSSQSRRIIKQLKAEKKAAKKNGSSYSSSSNSPTQSSLPYEKDKFSEQISGSTINSIDCIQDTRNKHVSTKNKKQELTSWTISGREAEALHLEEEESDDNSSQDEEPKDPLQKMLQSGAIPDAHAIHAARKKREAMRASGQSADPKSARSYISLKGGEDTDKKMHSPRQDDDDDSDAEESRINFTGVRSAAAVKSRQFEELDNSPAQSGAKPQLPFNEEEDHWEQQQIRKAMKAHQLANVIGVNNGNSRGVSADPFHDGSSDPMEVANSMSYSSYSALDPATVHTDRHDSERNINSQQQNLMVGLKKPTAYNLDGIKDRIKDRLQFLKEVSSRHESDLDRAYDDMITSKMEIDKFEGSLPETANNHRYYQDLRGYVTDLVECYDEKLLSIKYLEDKFYKSKSDMTKKLMERRRQDVRDQMKELSSNSKPALLMNPEETVEEEARQRRAAEREGRRRRRLQHRKATQASLSGMKHADGMSSDDEMSSLDQSTLGKVRQDVENQARTVMSDVVEEFSSLECVSDRLQQWREDDISAYTDAFVSLCLPKIYSPLVRLQILFWNPLTEHNNIETMPWYKIIGMYASKKSIGVMESGTNSSVESSKSPIEENRKLTELKNDPDLKLLSLVLEKVVIVRITNFVRSGYDPLSTTQTLKLTGLLERFIDIYPTINGESRQVRDLLEVIKERLKSAIDNDVYIPVGYPKHLLENSLSAHAAFLQRQFWGAFKLYRNVLAWQGILSDSMVAEMALNSILNRYMVIALGVMVSCGEYEQVRNKCNHIIRALPSTWVIKQKDVESNDHCINSLIYKVGLQRFGKFLVATFGSLNSAIPRKCVEDTITFLKIIGAKEDAQTIERKLSERDK